MRHQPATFCFIFITLLLWSRHTVSAQPWTNEVTDTFFTPHAESAYRIFQQGPSPKQVLNRLPGNGWLTLQENDTCWLARPLAEGKWEAWSLLADSYDDQQVNYSWQRITMQGKPCWLFIACDQFSHTAATYQNGNKSLRVQYWDLSATPHLLLSAEETAISMSSSYDDEGNLFQSQEGKIVRNRIVGGSRCTEVGVWEGDSVICHYEIEWKSEPDGWHFVQLKNLPMPADRVHLINLFPGWCWPSCKYWFETEDWIGHK